MLAIEVQPAVNTLDGLPRAVGSRDLRDERWVVARAKSGHEDAFGELYELHRLKVYRTALRILRNQQDAEDAVQRTFQRALVNLERFREDSAFATWLTRIAINEALMLLRQRRGAQPLGENRPDAKERDCAVVAVDKRPTPEELLCEDEQRAALLQAIGRLRENLRVVVLHRELKGLTCAETAQVLGLSVSAVKARALHAKRSLRKSLERKFQRGQFVANSRKK